MTGGELQLASYGEQDHYLTGNPQISYFKTVYRRYTNFAMDSIKVHFNESNISVDSTTKLVCKLPRHGDLVSNMHFTFTLPRIWSANYATPSVQLPSSVTMREFSWINNIGNNIINYVNITIGGHIIDIHYGEWLTIWNQLVGNSESRYNRLIGNSLSIKAPAFGDTANSRGKYPNYWPDDASQTPFRYAIDTYIISTPLIFWFNRHPGLALPLIALQHDTIYINLELKPLLDLYTLYDSSTGGDHPESRIKPQSDEPSHNIGNFLQNPENPSGGISNSITSLDINAHLEVNYIFLSEQERNRFAGIEHEYLIETVHRVISTGNDSTDVDIKLELYKPVKELIWVAKRDDLEDVGIYNNYTNWVDRLTSSMATHWVQRGETKEVSASLPVAGPYPDRWSTRQGWNYWPYLMRKVDDTWFKIYPNGNDLGTGYVLTPNVELKYLRKEIITNTRITFNGMERIDKDNTYFQDVQPYQHYQSSGYDGLHLYSFSLNPKEFQPSGSCNMSRVSRINMNFTLNPVPPLITDRKYNYDIHIYAVSYNILRIRGGVASLHFNN